MESQGSSNQGQNGQIITNMYWDDTAHLITPSSSCYRQSFVDWYNVNGSGSGSTTGFTRQDESALSTFYHAPPLPQPSLYGSGCDPHLMCLRLGKRHYFGDAAAADRGGGWASSAEKKGKAYGGGGGGGNPVPRCQVEGCCVALVSAKDYHRRHKVCEMHAKAPIVVVLGLEQRFCQQCSRFHAVSEFDGAKRSCRKRLAGHNERRRKSSQSRSRSQGSALSLLSSKPDSWVQPFDLSIRSRAALHELIAEHRATILERQLIHDRDSSSHHHVVGIGEGQPGSGSLILQNTHHMLAEPISWEGLQEARTQVTLNLMQPPSSALGML